MGHHAAMTIRELIVGVLAYALGALAVTVALAATSHVAALERGWEQGYRGENAMARDVEQNHGAN